MKDAAREDAINLVLINNISRAESKVLKVEIQNGLQNEYTDTKTNDETVGQRNGCRNLGRPRHCVVGYRVSWARVAANANAGYLVSIPAAMLLPIY